MSYHYADASREADPHALPDVEVFDMVPATPYDECWLCDQEQPDFNAHSSEHCGWYYAFGFPGCLWDSEPSGPYATEAEALAAAREIAGCCEHGKTEGVPCPTCEPERFGQDSEHNL